MREIKGWEPEAGEPRESGHLGSTSEVAYGGFELVYYLLAGLRRSRSVRRGLNWVEMRHKGGRIARQLIERIPMPAV